MNEKDFVEKLEPFLNEEKWNKFLEQHNVTNKPGFTIKSVTQLLQRKCKLKLQKKL